MLSEQKVNILLVDDHPENLLALEAILSSLGQNLVKADSGKAALRCLLHQDFAVILLDVQMPDMDGFETATLIRARERSRYTPIIFLTAFSSNDTLIFQGYSLRAVDYLVKPFEPEILKSKVGVFVDLFKKTAEVKQQAAQLEDLNAELRASEERFRSLSASSPVGIFLIDIEGHCTYTNPRCQAICDFPQEQSTLQEWSLSIHPDDRDRVVADWLLWTKESREYASEFRLLTKEGIVLWVHLRSSPMLRKSGELSGHVGTIEDITERKQADVARAQFIREQVARQEAEAANRLKDEFLATLSHEIRTPLNAMLGWITLLRTRSFDEATVSRALETIDRNTKSLATLIEDVLDVSRIITGKLRLDVRVVELVPLIEAAIDVVLPAANAKAIEISSHLEADVGAVSGDPDRLQQVVWNLLSNAVKFTPKGGRVDVSLSRINSRVQIQVSDTGAGISTEFLPYVFDRFRQADSTTTRSHGGLGLGLAIVRHLVELHGGTVHAHSPGNGKGATFCVCLPVCAVLTASSAPEKVTSVVESSVLPSHNSKILDGLRVLVVDDEADAQELLATCLKQYGAKVITVASAAEAFETLLSWNPDVLVSDIGMPGEDGYALIRKVRTLLPEGSLTLPAIALTAYGRESDRQQALLAGFQMHLSKPVAPSELIAMIAQLVGRTK